MKQIRNDSMNTQTAGVWVNMSEREPEEFGRVHWRYSEDKLPSSAGAAFINKRNGKSEYMEWLDKSIPTLTIPQALELWEDARDYCDGWLYDKRTYFLNKFGFDIDKTVK